MLLLSLTRTASVRGHFLVTVAMSNYLIVTETQCNIIHVQIVTVVEVTIGNCSPKLGKHCPTPTVEGNISPTEGKQFPVVTYNNCHYLFCYTS